MLNRIELRARAQGRVRVRVDEPVLWNGRRLGLRRRISPDKTLGLGFLVRFKVIKVWVVYVAE
eukprot:1375784-Amorphochlora_amoeboformis.AAC.1